MNLISESEYNQIIGKILIGGQTEEELTDFLQIIQQFESMLDEADCDDYFGTEGWRHRLGWD